jgi:ribose 5-phosphate isomerase B
MRIAIGADHAGFEMKERLRRVLESRGHEVDDRGTYSAESCDYPDFGAAVAREVAEGRSRLGVVICGTGVGISIAANKVPGIRAAVGYSVEEVALTRAHNDANILAIGARFFDEATAEAMLEAFLATPFEGGRHARRVAKIAAIELGSGARSEVNVK